MEISKGVVIRNGDVVTFVYNNHPNRIYVSPIIVIDDYYGQWLIDEEEIILYPFLKDFEGRWATFEYLHNFCPLNKITSILYGVKNED